MTTAATETVQRDEFTPSAGAQVASGSDAASARRGGATAWAVIGTVWLVVAVVAVARWIGSPELTPVQVMGPDTYPAWREVALRVLEVASSAVLLGFLYFGVARPWRRDGKLSLDGKFVLGGVVGAVADGCLNLRAYLFAWNAHSVNLGVWTSFLPFHSTSSSSRYAEGLLWGVPMYIYFCAGAAVIGSRVIAQLRRRFPTISNVTAYSIVYLGEFVAGLTLENVIIRVTQAYGYAQTPAAVTLFPGSQYQFPVYESLFTAALGVAFTYVRMSAIESPDGVSCIERGFQRWNPRMQGAIRLLAVIGFCFVALIMLYHLPFNWLGLAGGSRAALPSYMLPN